MKKCFLIKGIKSAYVTVNFQSSTHALIVFMPSLLARNQCGESLRRMEIPEKMKQQEL